MSCIRFNLDASEEQRLARANAPKLQHSAPEWTETKASRLHEMVIDDNPYIRSRAALDSHLTDEDAELLAYDLVTSVRTCLARNEKAPHRALFILSRDKDVSVRGFVAMNYSITEGIKRWLDLDDNPLIGYLANLADHRYLH